MGMHCYELLDFPNLEGLELVAGKDGLSKSLFWVHVAEAAASLDELFMWLKPDDFLIVGGTFLNRGPNMLRDVIRRSAEAQLSGLLLYRSPRLERVPDELVAIADAGALPVFIAPERSISILEVSYYMTMRIMEQRTAGDALEQTIKDILYGYDELPELKAARARHLGYELERPHSGALVRFLPEAGALTPDEARILELCSSLVAERIGFEVPLHLDGERLFMLLPSAESGGVPSPVEVCLALTDKLNGQDGTPPFFVGVGSVRDGISQFRESLREAETITSIMQSCGFVDEMRSFDEMLPYLLLDQVKDTALAQQAVVTLFAPIIAYDARHGGDLMGVLKAYLYAGGNVAQTAQRLFMHRNTLLYQLKKIEELARVDLRDADTRFKMLAGFYLRDMSEGGEARP